MNVMFITWELPFPLRGGVSTHDYHLIRRVAEKHSVFLLSLVSGPVETTSIHHLRQFCDSVDAIPMRREGVSEYVHAWVGTLLRRRPLATFSHIYRAMSREIRRLLAEHAIEIVQIEHSFLAPYVAAIPEDFRGKTVLSFHNVGVHQYQSMVRLEMGLLTKLAYVMKWWLMRNWEARVARRFNHSTVVSAKECALLKGADPSLDVSVIDNGVDTKSLHVLPEPSEGENTLLFTGVMGYEPNVDAVLYFCREVLPLVQEQVPDVKLLIVGRAPTQAVRDLASRENVEVTGEVKEVREYYQRSRVVVVPLRAGGGTRLKILEAMAYGRPIVSTSVGCEGLEVEDNETILIADAPLAFSDKIVTVLRDRRLRERIAQKARLLVEARYDWACIGDKLLALYQDLNSKGTVC